MSAGQRRDYVCLLIPITVDDGEGGQTISDWKDGPFFWSRILPVSAREQAIAGAIQTIGTHIAELPFDRRVKTKHRLRRVNGHGPDLNILGVRDPDGLGRDLEVDLEEVV